jgi:transposase-like protein
MQFTRPIDFYASNRFLRVNPLFLRPIDSSASNPLFLRPIDSYASNEISSRHPKNFVIQKILVSFNTIPRALLYSIQYPFVNHKLYFVDPADPNVHTQGIEGTWSAIKRSMRHLQGTSRDLFPTYLYQYMYRRAHDNTKIFQHLLEEIRIQYPL